MKHDRRQFLHRSGLALGFATVQSLTNVWAAEDSLSGDRHPRATPAGTAGARSLVNTNVHTAIGLGDQTPGIVDQFGQLDARHARLRLEIGAGGRQPADYRWSQALEGGYLPIVRTEARSARGAASWRAYAAREANIEGEWLEV